jgi:hypothetical protein
MISLVLFYLIREHATWNKTVAALMPIEEFCPVPIVRLNREGRQHFFFFSKQI